MGAGHHPVGYAEKTPRNFTVTRLFLATSGCPMVPRRASSGTSAQTSSSSPGSHDETSDHGQSDWLSTKSYKSSFAGWLVMFHPKQKNGLNYHKLPMQLGMRCCKRLSLATWEKSIPNPPKNAWEDDPLGAGWAISKEYMGKTTMTNHSHNPRMGEPQKKWDTLLKSGT